MYIYLKHDKKWMGNPNMTTQFDLYSLLCENEISYLLSVLMLYPTTI